MSGFLLQILALVSAGFLLFVFAQGIIITIGGGVAWQNGQDWRGLKARALGVLLMLQLPMTVGLSCVPPFSNMGAFRTASISACLPPPPSGRWSSCRWVSKRRRRASGIFHVTSPPPKLLFLVELKLTLGSVVTRLTFVLQNRFCGNHGLPCW